MRKNLLAATAVAALLSGAAWAQDADTSANAGSSTGESGTNTQQVLPGSSDMDTTNSMNTSPEPIDSTASSADPATTDPLLENQGTDATTGTTADTTTTTTDTTSMAASDIGSMSAEELIGTDIVDQEGNSVGEVSDLVLAADGQGIDRILVDVGGFLGIGARTVGIDPAQLQMAQGDGGDLVTSMSREQIEGLQSYEQRDGVWGPATE